VLDTVAKNKGDHQERVEALKRVSSTVEASPQTENTVDEILTLLETLIIEH